MKRFWKSRACKVTVAIIALVLMLALSFAPYIVSLADAGDFSGSSDFGGGSDWGGSSDWGSSDWDSDYSGSGGGDLSPGSIVIIVIVLIIIFIVNSKKKKGGSSSGGSSGRGYVPVTPPAPADLSALQQKDPQFSKAEILEKAANLYVQMQNAWQAKQFEPMRPYMTDALYNQFARQLQAYIDNGQTNRIERIAVLSVEIIGYAQDEQNDILNLHLSTRIVDYWVEDASGRVLRGDPNVEKFMTYQWTLIRSKTMQTLQHDAQSHINCPNCGAPLSIMQSGQCEFCGTVVTLSDHDWVISAIKGLSQRTAG